MPPLLPDPQWPIIALAALLAFDVALSLKPPRFIRDCLDGVHFPPEWWWTLIVIKTTAVVGLLCGLFVPGVALAANIGVSVYFSCAAVAHIRARFLGAAFWFNCLGFLAAAVATLIITL